MIKETLIYQGDSKWSRNAYIKFVDDKIVFDCSDGEYGPIEFNIQAFYEAELKHAQDIDNDWDVTLMDGLENEPYVSDDFQIGPDGAYEHIEEDQPQQKLIELLENQIMDLIMMSKIELGDDVIAEIKRLKDIINEDDHLDNTLHDDYDFEKEWDTFKEDAYNWTLVREKDGLTKQSKNIKWIEWNAKGLFEADHEVIGIGRSLIMSPFNECFTWQTTQITEILEEKEHYIKFKTLNSTYELFKLV